MFTLHYTKIKPIKSETLEKFAIQDLQLYNPIYDLFFEMNTQNCHRIALNHPRHIKDLDTVMDIHTGEIIPRPIFVKFSPLLDPYRYMTGKYDVTDDSIRRLPTPNGVNIHSKILSPHNASYVDCFFNYLSCALLNAHGFYNGIHYYGSFLGIQKRFCISIGDDLDYLVGSDFFKENVGTLFSVDANSITGLSVNANQGQQSRINKNKLIFDDSNNDPIELNAIVEVDDVLESPVIQDLSCEIVYKKESSCNSSTTTIDSEDDNSSTGSDSDTTSVYDSDTDVVSESGNDTESSTETNTDSDSGSEEEETYAYIHDFPVQMICLEKYDGTLDQLFTKHKIGVENGISALFQIIMTLLSYQKAFKFTHNDLHTNNIMYSETEVEHVYYQYSGKIYKIPTYGRIFKIIDYGRSIYRFQEHLFCSDSFGPDGDAVTQYNCEPFMNKNKARLDPNFSFDLCRLGSSIFDFIMDPDDDVATLDPLQKIIYRWCLDDHGKNILYKKNGQERYPNFKLYKMIARTVHQHTPEAQLEYDCFQQFICDSDDVPDEDSLHFFDIDGLPVYYK